MKNLFIGLFIAMGLVGCDDTKTSVSAVTLWNDTSKTIKIIQDNGNVPPETSRYIEYNASSDTLDDEALRTIEQIKATDDNLLCANDAVTYEVVITDLNDIATTYVSNNRDCGRDNENLFVATDDIERLLVVLKK